MPDHEVALMQQLHDEHAAALWGYCLSLTGHDRARAEDVTQETLLRAWRNRSVLDRPGVRRAGLAVHRRPQHRHRRVAHPALPVRADRRRGARAGRRGDRTDRMLQAWVVADALTKLSEEHRAVLLECYYRGMPVAEAARHLGVPEGTVKSRTHYALRALRLALEEMGVTA